MPHDHRATTTDAVTLPSDQDASGRTFGPEEVALLADVVESGVLISTKGAQVKALESRFAGMLGAGHAHACSSGTAAVHTAIAALDLEPGDEVITTPITDMGALTPILFQGLIPVFADVDVRTCNVTAETIAARISARTRAIVVTHLFGNPCQMDAIMELAARHDLMVIEDAAQAFYTRFNQRPVGTIGHIGCFSFQQGKHMTCGEGGMVVTDDAALARRMFLFINKAWGYGDTSPDHYFLALNYRMTELQGAVALAQLGKLESNARRRIDMAQRLTERLAGVPGIATPHIESGDVHSYWKFDLRVDAGKIQGGAVGLAQALKAMNIASAPRYIQKPAFMCEIFRDQRTFGSSRWPFSLASPAAVDYRDELFPASFAALEQVLVLPINERYSERHIDYLATAITDAARSLQLGG